MIVRELEIPGAYLVECEAQSDERGSFGRWFDIDVFAAHGLVTHFEQDSIATNWHAGTVRGLHVQAEPFPETKLVMCVSGAAFDVIVDLRAGSTFGRHAVVELSAHAWHAVYIPAGCAHGYQTRVADTTLVYRIAGRYVPQAARGVRFDDAELGIRWPLAPSAISDRDKRLPPIATWSAAALEMSAVPGAAVPTGSPR